MGYCLFSHFVKHLFWPRWKILVVIPILTVFNNTTCPRWPLYIGPHGGNIRQFWLYINLLLKPFPDYYMNNINKTAPGSKYIIYAQYEICHIERCLVMYERNEFFTHVETQANHVVSE